MNQIVKDDGRNAIEKLKKQAPQECVEQKIHFWFKDMQAIEFFYNFMSLSDDFCFLEISKFLLDEQTMVSVSKNHLQLFVLRDSENINLNICSVLYGIIKKDINKSANPKEFSRIRLLNLDLLVE